MPSDEAVSWSLRYKANLEKLGSRDLGKVTEVISDLDARDRERGFALMSQRWRAIQHVSLSPTTIGDIVKSALVLTQFEHKMISS
jgi:hypothetical protein